MVKLYRLVLAGGHASAPHIGPGAAYAVRAAAATPCTYNRPTPSSRATRRTSRRFWSYPGKRRPERPVDFTQLRWPELRDRVDCVAPSRGQEAPESLREVVSVGALRLAPREGQPLAVDRLQPVAQHRAVDFLEDVRADVHPCLRVDA
jgi:hypothetical protein